MKNQNENQIKSGAELPKTTSGFLSIREKAEKVKDFLIAKGYHVELSVHPTSWGESAYLRSWFYGNLVSIKSGFRLSDHNVGERRRYTDELSTIINSPDITVESLIARIQISPENLARFEKEALAKRAFRMAEKAEKVRQDKIRHKDNMARMEAQLKKHHAFMLWVDDNCPDWNTFTKTRQKKIKKRFYMNYSGDENQVLDYTPEIP